MIDQATCPVCGALLSRFRDTLDGHTLLEDEEKCPNGCYYSAFSYGNRTVEVGGELFQWGYSDPVDFADAQLKAVQQAIAKVRAERQGQAAR